MRSYGNVIKDMCIKSTNILNKSYPIINKLIEAQIDDNDAELSFCWRLMKYYFDETKEDMGKGYYSQFLDKYNYCIIYYYYYYFNLFIVIIMKESYQFF